MVQPDVFLFGHGIYLRPAECFSHSDCKLSMPYFIIIVVCRVMWSPVSYEIVAILKRQARSGAYLRV